MSSLHPLFSRCDPAGRRPAKLSIEELHRNKSCCAQRTIDSALHRRRKQIGRRFERPERACKTTGSRRVQRPLADFAEPPQSKRRKGLRRKSGVFCARSVSAGVVTRCFSPCLIFWCFWIKTKAHKKEYAPQKKSILRKEFRRQDRLRRICGPKAAGHAHGGGPPQAETSTRTAQRPAIFQAGLWGFARPKPGLHGTLLREFPKSSFKQEISARPAPFRPARPPDIPKGNRHTERSTRPPINNGNRFL